MKLTAVEFLADKFNYITWMRNRDEISAGKADEMRVHFFKQALEMEKEQIMNAFCIGTMDEWEEMYPQRTFETTGDIAEDYYNETYKQ